VTSTLDPPYAVLVDSAAEVLSDRGPLTDDQLVAELRDRGIELGQFPVDELDDAFGALTAPVVPAEKVCHEVVRHRTDPMVH
jgi:hypothetical protein